VEILLIRHALPLRVENPDGRPADPPLSSEGRRQAERVADWLAAEHLDALYTSPLRRARETAAPLASRTGLDARVEPGVVEMDHQAASYVPLEELKAADYPRWQELVQRGGLYAEVDLPAFRRNVVTTLERIVAEHAGARVAVICHGGVINAWAGYVLGVEAPLFLDVGYTSLSRFLAASTGERSVVSINETAHLRVRA
jgi:2,3-bisphosphoglycerate-dependent phosphoglycerate mutase